MQNTICLRKIILNWARINYKKFLRIHVLYESEIILDKKKKTNTFLLRLKYQINSSIPMYIIINFSSSYIYFIIEK